MLAALLHRAEETFAPASLLRVVNISQLTATVKERCLTSACSSSVENLGKPWQCRGQCHPPKDAKDFSAELTKAGTSPAGGSIIPRLLQVLFLRHLLLTPASAFGLSIPCLILLGSPDPAWSPWALSFLPDNPGSARDEASRVLPVPPSKQKVPDDNAQGGQLDSCCLC